MGPRSFERGNAKTDLETQLSTALQWGRAHSSAEIVLSQDLPIPGSPLQWGRAHSSAEIICNRLAVQDAPQLLQWGRAHSSAEIVIPRRWVERGTIASMGPRSFERGNGREMGLADIFFGGFNGAALIRARKLEGAELRDGDGFEASMGPRSFERGNQWQQWRAPYRSRCFNGAALIRARK